MRKKTYLGFYVLMALVGALAFNVLAEGEKPGGLLYVFVEADVFTWERVAYAICAFAFPLVMALCRQARKWRPGQSGATSWAKCLLLAPLGGAILSFLGVIVYGLAMLFLKHWKSILIFVAVASVILIANIIHNADVIGRYEVKETYENGQTTTTKVTLRKK